MSLHTKVMKALDDLSDTIQWWEKPIGKEYGTAFMESVRSSGSGFGLVAPNQFASQELYRLSHSPLYWIEEDMEELLKTAVKTFPAKRLWAEDLPSPSGFAYFEKPIFMPDRSGQLIGLKGICWHRQTLNIPSKTGRAVWGGVSISLYNYRDDLTDENNSALRATEGENYRLLSPLGLYHYLPWPFGAVWIVQEDGQYGIRMPGMHESDNGAISAELLEAAMVKLREETEDELPDGAQAVNPLNAINRGSGWFPLVDCLWTLLQQKVTHTTSHHPDRHTARRIQKVMPVPEIQIVTLRKQESRTENEEAPHLVNWSHRWIVDGHWRWQWYASENKHKRIWITPFVKGPDDRPLVVKDRVYAWRR